MARLLGRHARAWIIAVLAVLLSASAFALHASTEVLVCVPASSTTYVGYEVIGGSGSATYILGVNATSLPPSLVDYPPIAYVPVASLSMAILAIFILVTALVRNSRVARLVAIVVSVLALIINLAFTTPMVTADVHCLVTTTGNYATVTVSVANPYYSLAHVASAASAIALVVALFLEAWSYISPGEGW